MLLMNLRKNEVLNRLPTLIAVLFIAVLTGLVAVYHEMDSLGPVVAQRALGIEEQQVVLGAVDRLQHRRPELSASVPKFDLFLNDHSVEVYTEAVPLVAFANQEVRFSNAFFETDTLTQEKALEPLLDKGSPFNVEPQSKALATRTK